MTAMEHETTVVLFFGGRLFREFFQRFAHRVHTVEDLDVYALVRPDVQCDDGPSVESNVKYRELKRYTRSEPVQTFWDRKTVKRVIERQVPHLDRTRRRVIFVNATFKSSVEEKLTCDRWRIHVQEDHSGTAPAACLRVSNKHRLAFPPDSFVDLFGGREPAFTRLSLGEYTTYGGTLEARTKCNPLYYLEIEHELSREPNGQDEIGRHMELLVDTLFAIVPYDLVARTMRNDATCTVRRERVDNIFDEFKRRFVNYNRWRSALWTATIGGDGQCGVGEKTEAPTTGSAVTTARREFCYRHSSAVNLFVMPKWDGLKATGHYCEGYLFMKDACGSLSTFLVDLPFDNDVILQLEIVEDDETGERLFVITEILAIVVKNHHTLYHVYNRNNTIDDTGRFAGNVTTTITLKYQFNDPTHRCSTYRLVAPNYSLLIFHYFHTCKLVELRPPASTIEETKERCLQESNGDQYGVAKVRSSDGEAVNTYTANDRNRVLFTTVSLVDRKRDARKVLQVLDRFHNYDNVGKRSTPVNSAEDRANRLACLTELSLLLPDSIRKDGRFNEHCEGLLVAFADSNASPESGPCDGVTGTSLAVLSARHKHERPALPDHGYVKVKLLDTIDLEYDPTDRTAKSASGNLVFKVCDVPEKLPGWAERRRPVSNNKAIFECYYDRDRRSIVYYKDRPDKNRADSDEKISAIDSDIIKHCTLDHRDGIIEQNRVFEVVRRQRSSDRGIQVPLQRGYDEGNQDWYGENSTLDHLVGSIGGNHERLK